MANQAELAARLCKADLVTEMVGEFPELQGVMGGYYARAEGLSDAVADAIRDHYKPVGHGDDVPTAPVTVAVSLADKLDTLTGFFSINEAPTGSKDPFALRRSAISTLRILHENGLRLPLREVLAISILGQPFFHQSNISATEVFERLESVGLLERTSAVDFATKFQKKAEEQYYADQEAIASRLNVALRDLLDFLLDRLKVQQREAGVRHDLIDAVFALGGEDDLVRLLARVKALQNYVETAEGANLLAAYKRAANILKKEDWHGIEGEIAHTGEEDPLALVDDPAMKAVIEAKMAERHAKQLSYTPEPAEQTLIDALAAAEPEAAAAIEAENFSAAMAALASLRAPIDAFFEEVTVNDEQENKRSARLDLLARFRAAVHNVADFSRIEG